MFTPYYPLKTCPSLMKRLGNLADLLIRIPHKTTAPCTVYNNDCFADHLQLTIYDLLHFTYYPVKVPLSIYYFTFSIYHLPFTKTNNSTYHLPCTRSQLVDSLQLIADSHSTNSQLCWYFVVTCTDYRPIKDLRDELIWIRIRWDVTWATIYLIPTIVSDRNYS